MKEFRDFIKRYPNFVDLENGEPLLLQHCLECKHYEAHGYQIIVKMDKIFICDDCLKKSKKEAK